MRRIAISPVMMNPNNYATEEDMKIVEKYRNRNKILKLPKPKELDL